MKPTNDELRYAALVAEREAEWTKEHEPYAVNSIRELTAAANVLYDSTTE